MREGLPQDSTQHLHGLEVRKCLFAELDGCGLAEDRLRLEQTRCEIKHDLKNKNTKLRFYSERGRKLSKNCDSDDYITKGSDMMQLISLRLCFFLCVC